MSIKQRMRRGWWRMAAGSLLTGVVAGAAGVALTLLLHLVQHVAFGYTENTFLVGVERASALRRVAALAIGGAVVGPGWWLLHRRADAEDVSVTRALRVPNALLPVRRTVIDAVLQVVAVGAGASLGREGAPRQVGAALGGWIAGRLELSTPQRRTLVACGAGAGLAAVYNVPLGGAVFTLEILLASTALGDVLPALITAAIATVVAWPVLSDAPTYAVSGVRLTSSVVLWSVVAGPVAGIVGVGFVRTMSTARTHAPTGLRSVFAIVAAFAAVGALATAYPQVLGNGKGVAQLAFTGALPLGLAVALVFLKPLATAVCLGSGAIGGLLTPALATGAILGVATGRVWDLFWTGTPIIDFAVIGAAALLAVTQRAPLTGIVLTLEFLHAGEGLLAPVLVAVTLAVVTSWLLDREMRPTMLAARPPRYPSTTRRRSGATVGE